MAVETKRKSHRSGRNAAALAILGWIALSGCGGGDTASTGAPSDAPSSAATEPLDAPLAPDATLEQALAHRDPLERAKRVAEILSAAGPEQLDTIQAAVEAAPLAWGDIEYALFAAWWARFDPSTAIAYCEEELRLNHPRVVAEVLRTWGRTDPQAALDSGWLVGRTMDAQGLNPDYVDPLVVGWFESGKPGLENWIQGLDPSSKATALAAYMRMKILRDGRGPSLEWARTAPFTPDLQRLLLGTGLNIVARQEPELAVQWLDVAAKEGIDVRTFTARIARGWANHAPRDAMEWVMSRDIDPGERWRTVHDVARIWLNRDEKAVEEWLASHSTDAWADLVRKQAIAHHVKKNQYRVDWPALMARAATFVNEDQRRSQYLWNIQRWKLLEPEAAATWLDENAELLGEQLQYVDHLVAHERKQIEDLLAAEAAAKAAGTSAGQTSGKS